MNTKVFSAVLRRNFAGYIANSVNYLVICVFVLLFAVAALWPSESFPSNLHQFDKLFVFWLIMLGLILTLLMRTWAAEPPPEVEQLSTFCRFWRGPATGHRSSGGGFWQAASAIGFWGWWFSPSA